MRKPVRIGVGGPVGSGKTALVDRLCRAMAVAYEIAVVTNDIYTREDAEFLIRQGVLPRERIVGVETGGCPHTAIREDVSMNLAAVEGLVGAFPGLDLVFVESGGDNLAATFSPELADAHIYRDHMDGARQQLTREPYPSPRLALDPALRSLDDVVARYRDSVARAKAGEKPGPLLESIARLEQYQFHPPIEAKMAV